MVKWLNGDTPDDFNGKNASERRGIFGMMGQMRWKDEVEIRYTAK